VKQNLLKLFNSMTRTLEEFQPLEDKKVKIYTCGPSVYQLPHIGNYRTFLYEDVLLRYLEYLGYKVERTLFITDVEDKAIAQAKKERKTLKELTEKNTNFFLIEFRHLGAKMPTYIARSSTTVDQAVKIIEILLQKNYAYRYNSNVYFDPLKFKGFGKLYRLDVTKWPKEKRRFHKDTYPGNRWNLGDFILWHSYQEADREVYWNTKLGKGRPAWNIQDPAMAARSLGLKVDIYCGGVDNMTRHHDYVIAIVESITRHMFAHFWLHGEHLFINGKKMSKSRGNIIYPKGLIKCGCHWAHIRFFLINSYYRKRMNFTHDRFKKACYQLDKLKEMVEMLQTVKASKKESSPETKKLILRLKDDFERNMNNDLHSNDAIDSIFNTVSKLFSLSKRGKISKEDSERAVAALRHIDQVLQFIF